MPDLKIEVDKQTYRPIAVELLQHIEACCRNVVTMYMCQMARPLVNMFIVNFGVR